MVCKTCGKNHRAGHPHLMDKIKEKGFPTSSRRYEYAHKKADEAERRKYGRKSYDALKKVDAHLDKDELAGKNLKSGKIEVSKKVPPRYRGEVAFHEKVENKILRRKK